MVTPAAQRTVRYSMAQMVRRGAGFTPAPAHAEGAPRRTKPPNTAAVATTSASRGLARLRPSKPSSVRVPCRSRATAVFVSACPQRARGPLSERAAEGLCARPLSSAAEVAAGAPPLFLGARPCLSRVLPRVFWLCVSAVLLPLALP
ncbi:unnamed protein product [Prorocentrum cordatum]|uniref:Uncharacterized protein n=1 Tax=Prorocentrum cordatum TaxID=2364126 RepID=A0ABN9XDR0_9DINO|nr:unnamed protein product [Polarella glacialis]